jgi:hypothetical protein
VVPTKLKVNRMSWLDYYWPSSNKPTHDGASLRGDVDLVFGEPIWFSADTTPAEATTRLEEALAAL